ncbi:MAG: DNA polymerase III subunit beta [Planctomycetes bacterium]|nr:DNA polymerase III subunit beta [Planctomycetota bacterium]
MKIRCNRQGIADAFSIVSMALPTRSPLPILSNVKVEAVEGKLHLIAQDGEMGVRYTVASAEVVEPGSVVLPAGKVGAILREGQDETITIELDGHLANIVGADSHFKVVGADSADYPQIPVFEPKQAVDVPCADLHEMVRKTAFAVAHEVTRYALNGILFTLKGNEFRLVASDGKRLALIRRKNDKPPKGEVRVIVPVKALSLLEKVVGKEDEKVGMNLLESEVRFHTSQAMVFSRLVEGTFPDYEAVIPEDCDKKLKLKTADLLSAMKQADLLASEKGKATKLMLKENKLTLVTRGSQFGESRVDRAVAYAGQPFEVVFNPEYFIDSLRVIDEEEIEFELKDKQSAGVIRVGREYLYLVMPLTVEV